jgi:hypothetical protein
MPARQHALQRITEVLEQMPSVGYLHGLPRTLPYRFCIGSSAIAGDDIDLALDCQPACHRGRVAIPEQVNRSVAAEIDHDCAPALPASKCPVVNAELLRR